MTLHRTEEAEEKIAPNGRSRRENSTERKKQKRKLHRTEDGMRGYIDK